MTKEEVLKKFEELEYKVTQEILWDDPTIVIDNNYNTIKINLYTKEYYTSFGCIATKEHQLLTELFKALEWM